MGSVRTVQEHEETECLSHSNSLDGISLTDTVRRDVEDVTPGILDFIAVGPRPSLLAILRVHNQSKALRPF